MKELIEKLPDETAREFVESLSEVIAYLWEDEARAFEERGTNDAGNTVHIFQHLQILQRWLANRQHRMRPDNGLIETSIETGRDEPRRRKCFLKQGME